MPVVSWEPFGSVAFRYICFSIIAKRTSYYTKFGRLIARFDTKTGAIDCAENLLEELYENVTEDMCTNSPANT